MRVEFVQEITKVLGADPKAVLLTGDLGFNAFEPIKETFGSRFLNVGVAEQNMVGLAAGMALSGMHPWIYSIAPFAVYRCFEQIRNDLCFHNLKVRIVGNGGGYTYGIMGSTHHALEDLGVLKTLPNISLLFPATKDQMPLVLTCLSQIDGPAYLRLAVSGIDTPYPFIRENPLTLTRVYSEGEAVTVIAIGHAIHVALAALKRHDMAALGAQVFSLSKFPFNLEGDQELVESVRRTKKLIFIDEHYGSGSVCETLLGLLPPVEFSRMLCARYSQDQLYGSSAFHLRQSQMTDEDLIRLVRLVSTPQTRVSDSLATL